MTVFGDSVYVECNELAAFVFELYIEAIRVRQQYLILYIIYHVTPTVVSVLSGGSFLVNQQEIR